MPSEVTLLWRPESYSQYALLRRLLPEDKIAMVSPQFLIPLFAFFKSLMLRMQVTCSPLRGVSAPKKNARREHQMPS